jgi:hypothetical protein
MYSQKWNCSASLFPKQNYNVLSSNSYTHTSVRDLYIYRINLPILLQGNMWTDPGNIQIAHKHMNVEIGTEAAQFPEKKYINRIFVPVQHKMILYHSDLYSSRKMGCAKVKFLNLRERKPRVSPWSLSGFFAWLHLFNCWKNRGSPIVNVITYVQRYLELHWIKGALEV